MDAGGVAAFCPGAACRKREAPSRVREQNGALTLLKGGGPRFDRKIGAAGPLEALTAFLRANEPGGLKQGRFGVKGCTKVKLQPFQEA